MARRLVRSPKLLFIDPGLALELAGNDADRLLADPNLLGSALEPFVGAELLKQTPRAGDVRLLHFRDSNGKEVDWVLEDSRGRVVGIEVKASASPGPGDFSGLRTLAATVGDRFHRGFVLHTGTTTAPFGERMSAVPVAALWQTA